MTPPPGSGPETSGNQDPYARFYQFPASFGQERFWFLSQLKPDADIAYHLYAATRLEGPLDRLTLQRALDQVISSQESLRTGVAFIDGSLCQIIRPAATVAIPVVDRSALSPPEQQAEVKRLAIQESRRPFRLDDPPLLRMILIRLGEQEHVLVLVLHHLIADGWSLEILLAETARAYGQLIAGGTGAASEHPVQYADYAVWQREQLTEDVVTAEVAHWKARLDGLKQLDLPCDHPRPAIGSGNGSVRRIRLTADSVTALTRVAERHDATLYMVLLVAYQVVLARYSGQRDFAVGTAVANRTTSDIEGLIGLFANTLALRADLAENPTFTELLDRVRDVCLDAYSHQDLPFERLVEGLQPVRDLSRSPLFQVMFLFQKSPGEARVGELTMQTPLELDSGTAKFDLTLSMTWSESGIDVALEYSTDLFDPETADLLLDYYQQVVDQATRAPLTRVDDFVLGAPAVTGAPTGTTPDLRSVLETIAAVADRHPHEIAVADNARELTYQALLDDVERVAARLYAAGVRPGHLVAVCVPRSVELVVGLLATWRVGAAYVPIDLDHHAARISRILDDSAVTTMLTTSGCAGHPQLGNLQVVLTDRAAGEEPTSAPLLSSSDQRLAYVLYTSGSTGQPKGVQISHGNLAAHLWAMRETVDTSEGDTLAAVTSVSFDIAALELFLPLTCGGKVLVVSRDDATDGARLAELLAVQRIGLMQATPASWRLLLAADWRPCPGFRILCGGEALDSELAERLVATGATLWNLYGPTEATIWASAGRVLDAERVSLGTPLTGNRCYVLDSSLRPAPVGVIGELYLGGTCVGTGYLGMPAHTAERYLPDPFDSVPGARMYRTGDLCRITSRGDLQFAGRADRQVKIRGFRVECAEIESVLARHPSVEQVAVVDQRHGQDDVRLVAHVILASDDRDADLAASSRALQDECIRQLPAYAVPSAINFVDRMPLTPTGKVDHAALRELRTEAQTAAEEVIEPASAIEHTIAAVFAEVLGVSRVGRSASFFALGGHSLLAAKLMARVRDEIGVVIPVRVLFESPTVAGLAAATERALTEPEQKTAAADAAAVVAHLSDEQVEELLRQLTGSPSAGDAA